MKINISKSQWEQIGRTAGWSDDRMRQEIIEKAEPVINEPSKGNLRVKLTKEENERLSQWIQEHTEIIKRPNGMVTLKTTIPKGTTF